MVYSHFKYSSLDKWFGELDFLRERKEIFLAFSMYPATISLSLSGGNLASSRTIEITTIKEINSLNDVLKHPAERQLTSDWAINRFIMVVNKEFFQSCFGQKILTNLSAGVLKYTFLGPDPPINTFKQVCIPIGCVPPAGREMRGSAYWRGGGGGTAYWGEGGVCLLPTGGVCLLTMPLSVKGLTIHLFLNQNLPFCKTFL